IRDFHVTGVQTCALPISFRDGLALLRALDGLTIRFQRVGVPAYPEGHPAIADDVLWADLAAKQRYAHYAVTQLCFDADAICRFEIGRASCRGRLELTV